MVSRLTFAELFILSCCIHATVALQPILSGAFNRALHPIVYVPGFGDNQLQAKLSRSTVLNPSCQKKSDYFMVWLNFSMFYRLSVRCLTEDLRLVYRKSTRRTYDVTGVDVNVPGFGDTKTIKAPSNNPYHNSATSNAKFIAYLERSGYKSGVSLRGAPYDFRRGPHEQQEYFKKLAVLIEETYKVNNATKVLLVGYSLGGNMLLRFLVGKPQVWKSKYIKTFVTIAAPFGGSAKSLRAYLTGLNYGITYVPALILRPMLRSFSSIAALMPSADTRDKTETVVESKIRKYTAGDYKELFRDMGFETGLEMWTDSQFKLQSPGVQVYCFHGVDIPTVDRLIVDDVANPKTTKLMHGYGDGTVDQRSLEACKVIADTNDASKNHVYQTFPKVSHGRILMNTDVLRRIMALSRGAK